MRPGPGTAICLGLIAALFSIWATGGDVAHGFHVLLVYGSKVALILGALAIHEWAHGYTAYLLGDTTARDQGRLTLDPRSHFDAVGLLVVPGILTALHAPIFIGWAKPVPVDFQKLRSPRVGAALVAAAGPASNVILAIVLASFLRILGLDGTEGLLASAAWTFVVANLGLAIFNMLPFYPMDGGRIVAAILPVRAAAWLARNERKAALCTLLALIILPIAAAVLGLPISPLAPVQAALVGVADALVGPQDWFAPLAAWMAAAR